jgi:hypothetical protein
MSTLYNAPVTCSSCGHVVFVEVADSLNANRMPAARERVLARELFTMDCACGRRITAIHNVLYVDFERALWVQVAPEEERTRYPELEGGVLAAYREAFDPATYPKALAALGAMVRPRLAFGYEELREKVVAADAAIDDALLEVLKLELLVARPDLLTDGVELLVLTAADDKVLRLDLHSFGGGDGQVIGELVVARAGYESLVVRRAGVAPTYRGLFERPYVNTARYRFAPEIPLEVTAETAEA